jgi:hypothetical protein
MRRVPVACLILAACGAAADSPPAIDSDLWSLAAPAGMHRWIEIHDRAAVPPGGIYHIEVLERRVGDPPWKLRHLAPHLAVTTAALRASVLKPLRKGSVYPESFDAAYARWRELEARGAAPVCDSRIDLCLEQAQP